MIFIDNFSSQPYLKICILSPAILHIANTHNRYS